MVEGEVRGNADRLALGWEIHAIMIPRSQSRLLLQHGAVQVNHTLYTGFPSLQLLLFLTDTD